MDDVEECTFLSKISNDFILKSEEYFINTDFSNYLQLVIISELAECDLEQYMENLKKQDMNEEEIR